MRHDSWKCKENESEIYNVNYAYKILQNNRCGDYFKFQNDMEDKCNT